MVYKQGSLAIYQQIIEHFEFEIASERLVAGERIDSIRNLALDFKVNPNTIQKALNELENRGLVATDRTNGKYVTEDKENIRNLRYELAQYLGKNFVQRSRMLGLNPKETMTLLEMCLGGKE